MVFCAYLAFADTAAEYPRQMRMQQLRSEVTHLDEGLRQSARLAAATGHERWRRRYRQLESRLDSTIRESAQLAPETLVSDAIVAIDAVNRKLAGMEARAFELLGSDRGDEARELLFGSEYEQQKKLYAASIARLDEALICTIGESIDRERRGAISYIVLGAMVVPVIVLAWAAGLRSARKWRGALVRSNGDLSELTRTLDSKVARRTGELAENNRLLTKEVAERKLAEEKLLLSAKVFESSGECIVITDAKNRIISANRAFCSITGYSTEEVVGQTPSILKSDCHDQLFYKDMWDSLLTQGAWQGEIWNRRKNGEIFPQWLSINEIRDADENIANYIAISSDMTKRKAADERINFLAYYDALTELPNRVLLQDRLKQAVAESRRYGSELALMFLDLNRFKNINDSLGHHAGDMLLQEVGKRLKHRLREMDTVARMGGDEFVVLLANIKSRSDVEIVGRKIHESISRPMTIEGRTLTISPSIGISCYPADGADIQTLMKNADAAMYRCKEKGERCIFFTSDMNNVARKRLEIENGLRDALANNDLVLHYQPQFDLHTGRIVGCEALIRWQHPTLGLVLPMDFIPIAEESELIVPIGNWVLREACRTNAQWQHQGLPCVPVAVNVSAEQFRRTDFKMAVTDALLDSTLAPEYLELEITEAVLIHDPDAVSSSIEEIRRLGVHFSIDDFGTGYSSLSYLKDLSLSKLKIDQSFIQGVPENCDDAAIVRAIVDMARSLALRVIAEGVETQVQADFLQNIHCDQAQGYLYSRSLPADEFSQLLANERLGAHSTVSG
ncbi:MAG: EAL domain-containing protein [Phycisphaerae bacterium]|jgi:diguanylate cyclase (GGDEF)-like protein/PAS domain S-box-containing protein|nr:EAL domain-containing protein [Phycisphaerae bacterium]